MRALKYSPRTGRTNDPMGLMRARCLPSQPHKTRESNLPARCLSCENESRSSRNPQNQRRLTRLPRDKYNKLATDWLSQRCARLLPPVRADATAAISLRQDSQGMAAPEDAAHRIRFENRRE